MTTESQPLGSNPDFVDNKRSFFHGRIRLQTPEGIIDINILESDVNEGYELLQSYQIAEDYNPAVAIAAENLQRVRNSLPGKDQEIAQLATKPFSDQISNLGSQAIATIMFPKNAAEVRILNRLQRHRLNTRDRIITADLSKLDLSGHTLEIAQAIQEVAIALKGKQ